MGATGTHVRKHTGTQCVRNDYVKNAQKRVISLESKNHAHCELFLLSREITRANAHYE